MAASEKDGVICFTRFSRARDLGLISTQTISNTFFFYLLLQQSDQQRSITDVTSSMADDAREELQRLRDLNKALLAQARVTEAQLDAETSRANNAEVRASDAETRASDAQTRASDAETRASDAQVRAEISDVQLRDTTIEELLEICHNEAQATLKIESDLSRATKGFTKVSNKFYPTGLHESDSLAAKHQWFTDQALNLLKAGNVDRRRVFSCRANLQGVVDTLTQMKPLASERAMEQWEHTAVNQFVERIASALCKMPEAQKTFHFDHPFSFQTHERGLKEDMEPTEPQTPPHGIASSEDPSAPFKPNARRPYLATDQVGVCRTAEEDADLIFIVEYKPPHKVTADVLQRGLSLKSIRQEILAEIMQPAHQSKRPRQGGSGEENNEDALNYKAKKIVAATVTQIFNAMIKGRVRFAYVTTGESYLWLHITRDDPYTLHWRLTNPNQVSSSAAAEREYSNTAVSEVLGFCLMAIERSRFQQEWGDHVEQRLPRFGIDDQEVLQNIPETAAKTSFHSYYSRKSADSPLHKKSKGSKSHCKEGSDPENMSSENDPSDEEKYEDHTPAMSHRPKRGSQAKAVDQKQSSGTKSSSMRQGAKKQTVDHADVDDAEVSDVDFAKEDLKYAESDRKFEERATFTRNVPYCTQSCLAGLLNPEKGMDPACPNYKLHPNSNPDLSSPRRPHRHAIQASDLLRLLYLQLEDDRHAGCRVLPVRGARGYLFKFVLLSHNYVFVAKGTIAEYIPCMLHEASIYARLAPLQGKAIPPCLGHFAPAQRFLIRAVDEIEYFLAMAYAGTAVDEDYLWDNQRKVQRLTGMMHVLGVRHGDLAARNVLWDEREGKLVLVDFSHSRFVEVEEGNEGGKRGVKRRKETSRGVGERRSRWGWRVRRW
ncbi:uncharacterized protein KY384_002836 [Bacidia gigantensis]|uniref:uncharacterized protein n=1 Tax=Bacidia gigantensis TaxID=2732470 RepID=UPI001D05A0BD|nr:uncharacterized protein KY384_002836 [Bacidia gigantensis]KAG8532351.1 hypothetical protein KY384_002836 [Bacidia gigantensis]